MKPVTRATKYLRLLMEGREVAVWNDMSRRQRQYATELVRRFHWTTHMAIQSAYTSYPTDQFESIYDYRTRSAYHYWFSPRTGRVGSRVCKRDLDLLIDAFGLCHRLDYTSDEALDHLKRRHASDRVLMAAASMNYKG